MKFYSSFSPQNYRTKKQKNKNSTTIPFIVDFKLTVLKLD